MRNLIVLIWKNYFFFLFLLLEGISIYMVVQTQFYQRASFINSSNAVSANVLQTSSNIESYFYLHTENENLAKENAELRAKIMDSYSMIVNDLHKVSDTVFRQKYTYTSAKVVNNSTNRRNNYITLDKGSAQGVTKDMGVISSTGVIGRVKDVSANFCTVMSLLHSKFTVNASVKKDGSYGPLTWDGSDYSYATLSDIPTHVRLAAGDSIVSSPYSVDFPKNIMIGTVESWVQESGKPFYTVRVKLSTDFKKITHVYIVNNMFKNEQQELEQRSTKDKDDQ
jgi:rod shape-determining protein MreC